MTYGDDFEESKVKRAIYWLGNNAKWLRTRLIVIAAASFAVFLLYCIAWLLFGGAAATREMIENTVGKSPLDPSAYSWYGGTRDTAVTPTVVAARRALNESHLLTLVSNHSEDRMPSAEINCADLLSLDQEKSAFFNQLLYDMEKYVFANTYRGPVCACAPMFGRPVQLLIIGSRDRESVEQMTRTDDDAKSVHYVYMLNPSDPYALQYDQLDGTFFSGLKVGMAVENETQDYRYNSPRGTYDVLRRDRLMIQMTDKECAKQRVTVTGAGAICASRCLDLMQGIDVRERARKQYARGVRLNREVFEVPAVPVSQQQQQPLRDEL